MRTIGITFKRAPGAFVLLAAAKRGSARTAVAAILLATAVGAHATSARAESYDASVRDARNFDIITLAGPSPVETGDRSYRSDLGPDYPGGATGYAAAKHGELSARIAAFTTSLPGFSNPVQASATAVFTLGFDSLGQADLVFSRNGSSVPGELVNASVNLWIDGELVLNSPPGSSAGASVVVQVVEFYPVFRLDYNSHALPANDGPRGFFRDVSPDAASIHGNFTSGTLTFQSGPFNSMSVALIVGAGVHGGTSPEGSVPRAACDFSSTVHFPTDGPVFNLPPDWTFNSTSLKIVNNRWMGGTPSAGVTAPASVVQECDDAGDGATVNFVFDVTPGAADLLLVRDATGARTLLEVNAPAEQMYGVGPVEFPHGSSTIVIELLDGATVVASATLAVQIEDTIAPVLAGAVDQTIELTGPLTTLYRSALGITVTDACDPAPTATFAPDAVPAGTTTVTVTGRDETGNTSTATFDVTVVDTAPPEFTVTPADVERHCEAGGTVVGFDVLADDLSGAVSIVCRDQDGAIVDPSGTTFGVGVHTVTCTATDGSGNEASHSFQVTVIDDEAPVLVVPADIIVPTESGECFAYVSFTVTATDECDPDAGIVCSAPWGPVQSGDAFPCGTTTVTCTATDHSGNAATSAFNITVQDREAPAIAGPSTGTLVTDCCGSPLTVSAASLGITATDNCDPDPALDAAPASIGPGTTEVVVTATDEDGNSSAKTVEVTVLSGPFEVRFLQPLDANVDNRIQPGRTVPVRVRVLCDNVFDAGVTAVIDRVERIDGTGTPIANEVVDDAGSSNDDGVALRLSGDHYAFNLSTKGWDATSGARFRVVIRVSKAGHVDTLAAVILKNK